MSPAMAVDANSEGTACSMTFEQFTELTEEQWEAIRAIRRKWPDEVDWLKVRRAIEEAGRECSEIESLREQRGRSVEYKEALKSAQGNLRYLQNRLSRLEMLSPSGNDLDGLPDPGLELLEERLNHLRSQYETWSTPFGGRKNRNRETLRNRLLSIWEAQLHSRIGSSKNKVDEPIGPLLRFLRLTFMAILGESPGPSGLKSIIDKAKKRRRRGTSKRRKSGRRTLRRQGQKN
jgi:hypothetical protein